MPQVYAVRSGVQEAADSNCTTTQSLDELTRGLLPRVVGNSQHRPSRSFARLGTAGRNKAASNVIALAASLMYQGVAPGTQCNEIFFGVASTMASQFNMVDL